MRVTWLSLKDFRNYAVAELRPCPGVTALIGDNAQGKTNLLEAIALCCTGRSHRTPRDRELIRFGRETGSVNLEVERRDGTHDIEILLKSQSRKQVRINGSPIARSGELMGHINGVLFAPEDLAMVKDGPSERRRFIDMELSQLRPAYYYALQRYQRALEQRNRLLRDAAANPSLMKTLPEWDEQLALSGATVIEHRRAFIERLARVAHQNHLEISGGAEQLSVAYAPSLNSDQTGDALREALLRALHENKALDLRRATTAVGPHRDDLALSISGIDARAFGSQGQQRTVALSLKLSELTVMREESGEWPVLMLDDVMSELDPHRRRQLLTRIAGVQVLVTCTDESDLAGAEVGAAYRVSVGHLSDGFEMEVNPL